MIADLREALAEARNYGDATALTDLVEGRLNDRVFLQALALGRLMRNRQAQLVRITPGGAFLPEGYLAVDFDGGQGIPGGFTCGISPDGDVSS